MQRLARGGGAAAVAPARSAVRCAVAAGDARRGPPASERAYRGGGCGRGGGGGGRGGGYGGRSADGAAPRWRSGDPGTSGDRGQQRQEAPYRVPRGGGGGGGYGGRGGRDGRDGRGAAALATPRQIAAEQLLRVEQQGAYVGLVNGAPQQQAQQGQQGRRGPPGGAGDADGGLGTDELDAELSSDDHLTPRDQRFVKELVAGARAAAPRLPRLPRQPFFVGKLLWLHALLSEDDGCSERAPPARWRRPTRTR